MEGVRVELQSTRWSARLSPLATSRLHPSPDPLPGHDCPRSLGLSFTMVPRYRWNTREMSCHLKHSVKPRLSSCGQPATQCSPAPSFGENWRPAVGGGWVPAGQHGGGLHCCVGAGGVAPHRRAADVQHGVRQHHQLGFCPSAPGHHIVVRPICNMVLANTITLACMNWRMRPP